MNENNNKNEKNEKNDKNEKQYTEGIKVSGGVASKVENFWYHYKWHTIGILAAVIVVLVCTLQMCSKESNDSVVVYAGSAYLTESEAEGVAKVLEGVMPRDFDGDGKKNIALKNYLIWNKEQIESIEVATDTEGNKYSVDRKYISDQKSAYDDYLLTGESSIFILEADLYESLKSADRILELSEVSEELCEYSSDGYGIKLSELPIYKSYNIMQKLPEDTYICILYPNLMGKNSKEKVYAFEKEYFQAIVEYGA